MKNLKDLEKHIKEVEEREDEIGEISVTGGGEAYDTPYAFKKKKKKKDESVYKQIASFLYLNEKNLDPVGKEDDDIDNDGDSDESDEYLKNRRKVISKAIKKQDESVNDLKDDKLHEAKKPKIKVSVKYAREASDAFRDAYSKRGKMTSTNTFEFNNADDAEEFAEYLMDYIDIPEEVITGYNLDESVNEAKYKDYKKDESMSSAKKINLAIREVNRKLFEIERILDQSYRLKTEDGVGKTAYTEKTKRNLYKISEKMYRISEKLRKY